MKILIELPVNFGSPLIGKTLEEIENQYEIEIISVNRRGYSFTCKEDKMEARDYPTISGGMKNCIEFAKAAEGLSC